MTNVDTIVVALSIPEPLTSHTADRIRLAGPKGTQNTTEPIPYTSGVYSHPLRISPAWDAETFALLISSIGIVNHNLSSLRCRHYIRFEGSMNLIGINIVALMMMLRIYALYMNQLKVVFGAASLLAFQIGSNTWLLNKGIPVAHTNRNIHGTKACTMMFDATNTAESVLATSTAWVPLVYETVAFWLTLYATFPSVRDHSRSNIAKKLFEDGSFYYLQQDAYGTGLSVIFSVTFTLTLMIIFAPDAVKSVLNQGVTMMSRITLNLKKFSQGEIDSYDLRTLSWRVASVSSMITQLFRANSEAEYRTFDEISTQQICSRRGVPDIHAAELVERTIENEERPYDSDKGKP
ncbi:hypothetical protein V5O48_011612 [Marasmius crinis-equi]|uniref:Uncharacterized protein n=1 Tax=Marasmius crinis-equi TaxID=585013 RepID=A0ABR3F597_9AGAR